MKKIAFTLMSALLTLAGHAQRTETEVLRVDTVGVDYKTRYTSDFGSNFYIQASFAGRILNGEEDSHLKFGDRLEPGFQFAVGKKLYPAFGVRLSAGGARLTGWNSGKPGVYPGRDSWLTSGIDPVKQYWESQGVDTENGYRQEISYWEVNADFLVDLVNAFNKYKRFDNRWGLDAYLGMGLYHGTKWHGMPLMNKVSLRLGAIGLFNITPRLALNLEYTAAFLDATFDGEVGKGSRIDNYMSGFVGLTYRIGRQGFRVERLISPESYAELNNRITTIRRRVEEESRRPDVIQVVEVAGVRNLLVPSVVFFQGKDRFNEELQMVNIFKMAKFMSENPEVDITVIGNTAGSDKDLSRKRAERVKDILVNRYSIAPRRLTVTVQDLRNHADAQGEFNSVNFSITQ